MPEQFMPDADFNRPVAEFVLLDVISEFVGAGIFLAGEHVPDAVVGVFA
jgi:hypothetical protein